MSSVFVACSFHLLKLALLFILATFQMDLTLRTQVLGGEVTILGFDPF